MGFGLTPCILNYYIRKTSCALEATWVCGRRPCQEQRSSDGAHAEVDVTGDRRRMATRRVAGGRARSARPPVTCGLRIDPGRGRGSNTNPRESNPRPLPRSQNRGVRQSGGLALRARPPATVRDAIRRRKTGRKLTLRVGWRGLDIELLLPNVAARGGFGGRVFGS